MSNSVKLVECPRDAWQGLHGQIPAYIKTDYLKALISAGFKHIDAASFVSPKAVPQMADSEEVLKELDPPDDVEIIGIVVNDKDQSVLAWLRLGAPGDAPMVVICNFTQVQRPNYRLGLPHAGRWTEVFNSDAEVYGGSGQGNLGGVEAHGTPAHGFDASAEVTLPPLSTVFLRCDE